MIEKLVARNFQVHKNFTIKFRPRVTYLIGPNDAGKSTLFRLLKWIALNKRSRSAIIRWGAKSGSGTLYIDGELVRRSTDGRGNIYHLGKKEFKAFRKDVPPDIQRLLNLSEINFQGQRENTFWFDLSPSGLAKELNKMVDLEAIDKIQTKVSAMVRKTKMELEVCEKRLKALEEKAKHLKPILRLDRKLGKVDKLGEYRLKSHRINRLASVIGGCVVQRGRIGSGGVAGAGAIRAGAIAGAVIAAGDRSQKLRQIVAAGEKIRRVETIVILDSESVISLLNNHDNTHYQLEQLTQLISKLTNKEKCLCQRQKQHVKMLKKLEKKLNGRCPLCGNILTDRSPV